MILVYLGDVENVGDFVYMKWKMEFDSEFLEKNLRRSFCEKRWKHRWKPTLGRHSWWIPLQGTVPLEYALHEDIDRHSKTIMLMDIVRKHPWIFLAVYFWKTLARTGGNFESSETELHDQWSHAWTKITWSTCITTICCPKSWWYTICHLDENSCPCTCHAKSSQQTWRSDAPKCNPFQEISALTS